MLLQSRFDERALVLFEDRVSFLQVGQIGAQDDQIEAPGGCVGHAETRKKNSSEHRGIPNVAKIDRRVFFLHSHALI
jgi:hypothetical protein